MAYTTIDKPTDYFNTTLYTGNGGNGHTISGVGFQSDLTWLKSRSSAISHMWIDSVRGVNTVINSNTSDAETTFNCLDPWNSDGFVLSNNTNFNGNGVTFASWNWKAGTSFTNDASATGIGSIDSTGSVNTDAGFSIVSWDGSDANATIGHGLGSAPRVIIIKNRESAEQWYVYHESMGNGNKLTLNDTSAQSSAADWWQDTSPTSSVFSVSGVDGINGPHKMIAYCFAEKQGYSKFGSYTANNNSDGAYIHLGFKPALFICKKSSGTESWYMNDNKRSAFNPTKAELYADNDQAEGTGNARIDLLSNGVKMRTDNGGYNTGSETYIYMAFAEEPFVTSTGVPACAR